MTEGPRSGMLCPDCMRRSFRLTSLLAPSGASTWKCEGCGRSGPQDEFRGLAPAGTLFVGKTETKDEKANGGSG